MIETSESIKALTAAILKVQGAISGVKRDGKNPHFKNRYATLENVIDTARPALQEAGIAFVQAPGLVVDGSVEVTTMLVHETGEWMRSTLHVPLGKRDAQGVGSAITYGCRYSLMAMLGLPPTDDDGHAASQPYQPPVARDEDDNRKTAGSVSYAEMKRGLAAIDEDLLDCHSIADVNKCAQVWSALMDSQEWTKVYRDEAIPKFARRRKAISEASTETEDAILNQFEGSKIVANSYVNSLSGG